MTPPSDDSQVLKSHESTMNVPSFTTVCRHPPERVAAHDVKLHEEMVELPLSILINATAPAWEEQEVKLHDWRMKLPPDTETYPTPPLHFGLVQAEKAKLEMVSWVVRDSSSITPPFPEFLVS